MAMGGEGACADHACDGCGWCRRGRCCGRDVPGYRRPVLGDWEGPLYGTLGVLAIVGDTVQCHACGGWYRGVGNHVWWTHALTAADYRAIFGLRARTGLVGPSLRDFHEQNARRHLGVYWPAAAERLRAQTPQQRSAQARGRPRPLEARLDPANRQSWTASSRRGGERMRQLWASGERQRPQPARTGWQKARARWLALLEDPAYRAEFKRKISAARAGRVEVPCATCGRPFAVARHLATAERRFCGTACLRELQRQRGREHGREMAARSRQLTKSCDACGEPFVGTGRQRYCSLRCKVLAKNHRVSYTCPGCSGPFTGRSRQRYCSRHCAARAARAAQANPPPDARASPDGR